MPTTTSLKLPDALKTSIARVAALEGKTSHALMVETLQSAMDDATQRHQFYSDGDAAYQEALRTNRVYSGKAVSSYIAQRVRGQATSRPQPVALDPSKRVAKV
jgi:predicted transcriptional regulator